MREYTTSDRLKQIMQERNLKQVDILEKVKPYCEKYNEKINKSHLSQWVAGINEPNQNKLFILASALNVSEAWLLGYDVSSERKEPVPEYDPHIQEVTDLFLKLNQEQKQTVLNMLRSFVG